MRDLLRQRQAKQATRSRKTGLPTVAAPVVEARPLYQTIKEQRQELSRLVSIWSRVSNEPHGVIHAELRRVSGGPSVAQASTDQIQKRIDVLRGRIGNRT